MLPLGVWVVVIVAMRSEGDNPKSMEGVLGDRAYHLAADHPIHLFFVPRFSARPTRVVIIDVLLSAVTPQTTVNNVHNSCVCSNYSQGTRDQ